MISIGQHSERTKPIICMAIDSPNPILRRYFIVCNPFWMGGSKTAHDRITRYAGGFSRHFSHSSSPFIGSPHFLQNGALITLTFDRQSLHHRSPIFPQPPQTGGNNRSIPLQVHRYNRYDHGIFFTNFRLRNGFYKEPMI